MPINHRIVFIPAGATTVVGTGTVNQNTGGGLTGGTFTIAGGTQTEHIIVSDGDTDPNFTDDDIYGQIVSPLNTYNSATFNGKMIEPEYQMTLSYTDGAGAVQTYTALAIRISGRTVGYTFVGRMPPTGVTLRITATGDRSTANFGLLCLAGDTLIRTAMGERRIDQLCCGDLVLTADHGLQPVRWIGHRRIPAAELQRNPRLRPIRIRRNALGPNQPRCDILVSPQHRILARSNIAQRMFGTREVLVAAKQLLQMDGVEIAGDAPGVDYYHLLFDRHEIIFANGAEVESLFTGAETRKSLGPAALEEILQIFPEIEGEPACLAEARTMVPGRLGRKLVARHVKNRTAWVQ